MKTYVPAICLAIIILWPALTWGSITMLSEKHDFGMGGYFGASVTYDEPFELSREFTSAAFSVNMGNFNIDVSVPVFIYPDPMSDCTYTYRAWSTYTFSATDSITVSDTSNVLEPYTTAHDGYVWLRDTTSNADLLSFVDLTLSPRTFSVDPTHIYKLEYYMSASKDGIGSWFVNGTLTPEPATIALFALGVLLLRRHSKH